MANKLFLAIIILGIFIRLYFVFTNITRTDYLTAPVSQDNYIGYIKNLENGTLNNPQNSETRFFPWYPVSMLLINRTTLLPLAYAGLLINFVSLLASIIIFWKITKDRLSTTIFSFFPPVWFYSPIKIATEPLTLALLLLSLFFYLKKKYLLTGLLIGISTGVRLISVGLFLALIAFSLKNIRTKIIPLSLGYLLTFSLLILYNIIVFKNVFYQIMLYPKVGGASGSSLSVVQIFADILRTISWHQYRILTSGLLYIAIAFIAVFLLYKYRNIKVIYKISFLWLVFSLLFIFSFGPNPMLEEFRRFLIPVIPAVILGITAPKDFYLKLLKKLSYGKIS
jgi:Gpi18-like mannosyltransferase